MFYHVKETQFNVRVSKPDPRFARLMLEQFGGANGELSAAMQYFVQAYSCKNAYPEIYDMLMDIAAEELGHLEMVGSTIQMLLSGINGEMKDMAENAEYNGVMNGKAAKEEFIHDALANPQFGVISAGSVILSDSNGNPWTGAYISANSDPTVDLRSNIASESRAKIVYEYLFKYTDDPWVKKTLGFLMTREITHYQQFEAALLTIEPNFPPGILQGNQKYSNWHYNMSKGDKYDGPWKEGKSTQLKEEWQVCENASEQANETNGLLDLEPQGTSRTDKSIADLDKKLSRERSKKVKDANPETDQQWSEFNGMDKMGKKEK